MTIQEHNGVEDFLPLIDEAIMSSAPWNVARIKKDYIRPMTHEAFMMVIKPVMKDIAEAHVFFASSKFVFVVWKGALNPTLKLLANLAGTALMRPGLQVEASVVVSNIDLHVQGLGLKSELKAIEAESTSDEATSKTEAAAASELGATDDDIRTFKALKNRKLKDLRVLIAEDQPFSQKLLVDILRNAKLSAKQPAPLIETAKGVEEAWGMYLRRAHDLVFVDLGLIDGSGHVLARAVKELNPESKVIIVTANNYEEELSIARQNAVDGFIAKPYNKKQILDYVDKCVSQKG